MSVHALERAFDRRVTAGRLIAPGEAVVAAVSGGADSMALLHLLDAFNRNRRWGCRILVAHLDHGLRGLDAAADAAFVARQAESLGLQCLVESADVAGQARERKLSLETAGRKARLEFLERVCRESGSTVVAMGHHADDDVETILHRTIRGTGLKGLGGIPLRRRLRAGSDVRIVRPLLRFRREALRQYLLDRGLPWREDASNQTEGFTRNRLRQQLLPLLRSEHNPRIDQALLRLASQARMAERCLTGMTGKLLKRVLTTDEAGQPTLVLGVLADAPDALRWRLIRAAAVRAGVTEGRLGYDHLAAAARLIDGATGQETHLPGGWRLIRDRDRLVFQPPGTRPRGAPAEAVEPAVLAAEGVTSLPAFGIDVVAELIEPSPDGPVRSGRVGTGWPAEEWLDADAIEGPLVARARRPGDRFRPLGMPGSKKLSDFFIDERIPAPERDIVCLLCDRRGPVWVVPWRIDDRVRVTASTRRVLRLVCRRIGA